MSRPRKYYKRKADGDIKARTNKNANQRQGEAIRGMNSTVVKDILRKVPEENRGRARELLEQYIKSCKEDGRTPRSNGAVAMLNNQLNGGGDTYSKNRTLILNLGMSVSEFNDEIGEEIDLNNTILTEGKNVVQLTSGEVLVFELLFNYDGSSAVSGQVRYKNMQAYYDAQKKAAEAGV